MLGLTDGGHWLGWASIKRLFCQIGGASSTYPSVHLVTVVGGDVVVGGELGGRTVGIEPSMMAWVGLVLHEKRKVGEGPGS